MIAAPLIAGNDLRKMSPSTKAILTNKDVIAINQDSLGIQALKVSVKDSLETWIKPLKNGNWAVCFLNRKSTPQLISYELNARVIEDTLAKRNLDTKVTLYKIKNIWLNKNVGDTKKSIKEMVSSHDVLMLLLSK